MKEENLRRQAEENGRKLRTAAMRLSRECKKHEGDINEDLLRSLSEEVTGNAAFEAPGDDELSEKLVLVKDRANRFAAEKLKTESAVTVPKGRKAKAAVALIAAVVVMIMSFTAVASISNTDLAEKISSIFGHEGNVTVNPEPSDSTYRDYNSAESLAKKENMFFLCPSELPNGIKLKSAVYKSSHGKRTIMLVYNRDIYSFRASEKFNFADSSAFPGEKNVTIGDVTFNIWDVGTSCQAYTHYNGLEYTISCKDEATFMTIFEGLKEVG